MATAAGLGTTTSTPNGGSTQIGVTAGAFCKPEGASGRTVTGLPMRCIRKAGEKQPRWRTVAQATTPATTRTATTRPATTATTQPTTRPVATPTTEATTAPQTSPPGGVG